ncbi:MAG: Flp family type IVb pilin [Planctomyces sp.]
MKREPRSYGVEAAVDCDCCGRPGGRRGAVTVEYLLLVTLVGIGVLVGLAAVRNALVQELDDVANAISAIV